MKKVLLCIMDGVGLTKNKKYNAVYNAKTPVLDKLWDKYPHSQLEASGTPVGLPRGQMGNSEVGHTNIGAGRLVYQSLELINSKIKDKSFYKNEELLKVINHVKEENSSLHLVGLLSDGGVHSHINHLFSLLELSKKEGLKKVLSGEDVSSLTVAIKEFTDVLGKELFSEIAKQLDEIIFEDNKKKKQYEPVRFQEKSLITKNGKAKFERRYYQDKETGEYVYLTDAVLGIDKGERIDKKVKSEVIERANDQSYNKSGKMVVPGLEISATTVMRNVRKNEWDMEIEERKEEDKIKAKYIYIQVDEDHIKERNKKGCTISKIVTIYTRKRILTKPDRIDEVQQVRKELVDKFTFSGLYKDNQKLWEDVAYYIDCTYKKDEIENIFIMGDGASYIKAGVEWIDKAVFVLDLFHLEKYINHLNYDEYLKSKLQEAIDQYDPISTENIMKEAIKKIKQEIKEDEQLGRNTKRLNNRLKKIENTKTYLMNQWSGIEAHDKYKDKLTGCCQEGQVHHTLSERMSTDAKVWCEEGIDEMSQLRAFTQNGGNIYQKIIDISTKEKRNKKIEALEKRIKNKAQKKLFGTTGVSIPTLAGARDELYYELKNIWYGKAV